MGMLLHRHYQEPEEKPAPTAEEKPVEKPVEKPKRKRKTADKAD